MNVSLTPQLEAMIKAKVESGMFSSASEVVRDGLRLLNERENNQAAKLEALRREIQVGIDQADRGEVEPLDVRKIMREARELRDAAKATNQVEAA